MQRQLGPEVKVLRVRRETGLQEMLREAAGGTKKTLEDFPRKYDEETGRLKRQPDSILLFIVECCLINFIT